MKKRSMSLRTQIFGVMALLVLLQSLALVFALVFSRVFWVLDAEAFRLFDSTVEARTQTYNESVGNLLGNLVFESENLSALLQATAKEAEVPASQLALSQAYQALTGEATSTLLSLLGGNPVSGAFFVLNGSSANRDDPLCHAAVYLRNSAISSGGDNLSNYLVEVGPISVSQQFAIPTAVNWRLDLRLDPKNRETTDFYYQPLWAAQSIPGVEMERYGYWSAPADLLGDGQPVVTYTLPLLDEAGEGIGVIGVEISIPLFTRTYLPNAELPYPNSFYAIARLEDSFLDLNWYIPSGPLAQVYLKRGQALPLSPLSDTGLMETDIEGLGSMYCATEALAMYSANSPFVSQSWTLVGFVPQAALRETSQGVRTILVASILITTALAFLTIFLLTYITTRKISGLSQYVEGVSPYGDIHFTRTGIREIDDLTAAVEKLNRSVRNASKATSQMMELSLLPIGGFESSSDSPYVLLTEFVYQLLHLPPGTPVSREAWRAYQAELMARPAEEFEHTYHYEGEGGAEHWLRILQAHTDSGEVGVILDVSEDVRERRRLSHELDYDALTHLLSRNAFKRKVHHTLQTEPQLIGAMVFVDLDNLKYMNDTFGHDMGDRLIIRAGELFRQFEQDGGVVSRISGDEFAIYLHGYQHVQQAREVVYRLFEQNESFSVHTPDGALSRVRFSAGIAFYPQDSDNVTDLLKLSDYAMYEAKHQQKGAIFEFNAESYQKNIYLLENREAINLLLDEGLVRFAFQPIVHLQTAEIYAYEALMRPMLETFKSPLEVLKVAAAQSKLGQLEQMVTLKVFQTIRDHLGMLQNKKVFVNSIPSQVLDERDHQLLEERYADIFPHIVVEVTEAERDAPESLARKMDFIQKHHIMLAIDDFGSGYSNEVRILSLAPDVLKIDIALISHIDTNPDKQQLVQNLISFCRSKHILTVAEGVERREELAALSRLGVDFVQGFYLGRPAFELLPIPEQVRKEILDLQRQKG